MKAKLALVIAALAAAAALVAVPLTSASSVDTKLQIGTSAHFTGPTSAAGTFVAAGAIRDSGTVIVTDLSVQQQGNQDDGRITATAVYTGTMGTFTETITGTVGPAGDAHQAATGTFRIVSGTGAYAGTTGQGTFLAVADATTNQVITTEDGQAN
jgi:hypothetical protein